MRARALLSWLLLSSLVACAWPDDAAPRIPGARDERLGRARATRAERSERDWHRRNGRAPSETKPANDLPVVPAAEVVRVVDGDMIDVTLRGREEDVQQIGVDTPETVHPSEPVECYGPAAARFTDRRLEGESVRLEFDVERRDQYGRLLAYVWIDGALYNRLLVLRGLAEVVIYEPNDRYEGRLYRAEERADDAEHGLWGACAGGSHDGEGAPAGSAGGGSGKGCDPNYEGACVPPYPPDVDCSDVAASGFRSVGSDPHGFDGDADGIACE